MKLNMYIRLSDADKDLKFKTESESIANQRALLRRYVDSHSEFRGYEIVEFIDDGYSGTNAARPSFERMIEGLKNGDANVVICKDFSRFFRDYVEIGDYLERIFPFLGVRFISVNDGYDSDEYKGTTAGMEVVMKYIVYSFYSRDLSQKVKTVLTAKAKHGAYIGSYAPFGYRKDPDKKNHLIIEPETAPIVRYIFDMALSGKSISQIAVLLNDEHRETPSDYFRRTFPNCGRFKKTSKENCWNSFNVGEILKRKIYTGAVVSQTKKWKGLDSQQTLQNDEANWIVVPNCHEAIVSDAEFEQAQLVIRKTRKYERGASDYLLRSLLHCGVCGRTLSRNSRAKAVYFMCDKSRLNSDTQCPIGEHFYEKDLERVISADLIEKLNLLVDSEQRMREAAEKLKGSEENLRQSLLRIERSLKQNAMARVSAYERYSDGQATRDAFLAERDKLAIEAGQLTADKERLENELTSLSQTQGSELTAMAATARTYLKAEELNNEMVLFFIDRVDVFTGMRLHIHYRFGDELAKVLEAAHDE